MSSVMYRYHYHSRSAIRSLTTSSIKRSSFNPPSHFTNPYDPPQTYGHNQSPPSSQTQQTQQSSSSSSSSQSSNDKTNSLKEITSLVGMCILAYLTIDNYTNRIKLEKLITETTAINLKTLQIQQTNFLNVRKKRDLQILQERRDTDKRDFKMSLHIALLRKQLNDLDIDPIDIDVAIKEFEKNVKADNSIKNVTGQSLWLDDNSTLKSYLPDPHDYDKRKNEGDSKS
ncbi:hypothetical protein DFJ63DRAFT_336551 [Scheffersomyces coipomensis]|uniref:uncharacterized protein n=1 Tax=Scheffersomyces coipomensis TaxID=1788519 RepID=UPI00315D4A5A